MGFTASRATHNSRRGRRRDLRYCNQKGSRAIDPADRTTTPLTDQRGFRRGNTPDIRAYERRAKK